MKKDYSMKYVFTLFTLSLLGTASAQKFDCVVKYNYETALTASFDLSPKSSKRFGSFEDYEFTLKHTGKIYELEIYNALAPSRTYAVGDLEKSNDLGLIIWNRENLMDVSCKRSR